MKITPKSGLSHRVTAGKEYDVIALDNYGEPVILNDNGVGCDASEEADSWRITDNSTVYTQSQAERMHELLINLRNGGLLVQGLEALLNELKESENDN